MQKNHSKNTWSILLHPLVWVAFILILFNALIFQPLSPSWFTGKLGDLAWMVVLPLVFAALISPIFRKNPFPVAVVISSVFFILLKAVPATNSLVNQSFAALFSVPFKLQLDPTDLLAMLALPIAWWVWHQPQKTTRRIWRFAPLALLVMVSIADAPAPGYDDIECLAVYNDTVVALTPERSTYGSKAERKAYTSTDFGMTWVDQGVFKVESDEPQTNDAGLPMEELMNTCTLNSNQEISIADPNNPAISYTAISGHGVYRSSNNGATLVREIEVDDSVSFSDLIFTPDQQTLILGAGFDGVLVRHPGGTYDWVDPSGLIYHDD
jgi:hypothetical protein